eukprot:gene32-biopygen3437
MKESVKTYRFTGPCPRAVPLLALFALVRRLVAGVPRRGLVAAAARLLALLQRRVAGERLLALLRRGVAVELARRVDEGVVRVARHAAVPRPVVPAPREAVVAVLAELQPLVVLDPPVVLPAVGPEADDDDPGTCAAFWSEGGGSTRTGTCDTTRPRGGRLCGREGVP